MNDIEHKLDKIEEKIDRLDNKLEEKIDKLDVRLDKVENLQGLIAKDLNYHIKRTDLLEEELKPIWDKHQQLMGVMKMFGWIAAMAGVIELFLHYVLHI